jgi:hypothetical protein
MEALKIFIEITGLVTLFLIFFYGMVFRAFEYFYFPKGHFKAIDVFKINPDSAKGRKIINKYRVISNLKYYINQKNKLGYLIDYWFFKFIAKTPYERIKKYNENTIKFYLKERRGIDIDNPETDLENVKNSIEYSGEEVLPVVSPFYTGILLFPELHIVKLFGYELYIIFISVIFSVVFFLLVPSLFSFFSFILF